MSESISMKRWVAKKAARAAMAFGSFGTGSLALRDGLRLGPEVRVLTYHRFGAGTRDPFRVSAEAFEAQVRHLAEHESALTLAEFEAFLRGELAPAPGAALLTIDDGSRSVHRVALPILRDHGVPAVLFTVTGAVGTDGGAGGSTEPFVTWDELGELTRGGVDVQSHGVSHRSMKKIGPAEAADEAAASKELLEARLGHAISSFAYPYGTRGDYDVETGRLLVEAGYRTIFTSQHGAVLPGADASALPRIKIESGEGMALFRLALKGGLDGWSIIDRSLHALQKPAGGAG